MKRGQKIALAICLVSLLATWLFVWKNHYIPCAGTLTAAFVSAWRTGWID